MASALSVQPGRATRFAKDVRRLSRGHLRIASAKINPAHERLRSWRANAAEGGARQPVPLAHAWAAIPHPAAPHSAPPSPAGDPAAPSTSGIDAATLQAAGLTGKLPICDDPDVPEEVGAPSAEPCSPVTRTRHHATPAHPTPSNARSTDGQVYYEGNGSAVELALSLLLGLTLVYAPLTMASIGRRLWIRYIFTNKRVSVINSSPLFKSQVDVAYSKIKEIRTVDRALGGWGEPRAACGRGRPRTSTGMNRGGGSHTGWPRCHLRPRAGRAVISPMPPPLPPLYRATLNIAGSVGTGGPGRGAHSCMQGAAGRARI